MATNAEHQAAWRQRRQQEIEALRKEAARHGTDEEVIGLREQLRAAKAENTNLRRRLNEALERPNGGWPSDDTVSLSPAPLSVDYTDAAKRLLVLWKKGRNMYASFFTELSNVRKEIGDENLPNWCFHQLRISLSIIKAHADLLIKQDAKLVKEELSCAATAAKEKVTPQEPEIEETLAKQEQRIKQLTTKNRNLQRQVHDLYEWRNLTDERGLMPYTTYVKVARALHPDTVWQTNTEKAAAQDEACKLLTAWGTIGKDRGKRAPQP